MAGLYLMTISTLRSLRHSPHHIEAGNVKLAKLIINSIVLTKNINFSPNTGKMYQKYSNSDTCKSKVPVSFALTLNEAEFPLLSPPVHAHKCKHSTFSNNCNRPLCETYGSNYSVLRLNLLVLNLFVNLCVL